VEEDLLHHVLHLGRGPEHAVHDPRRVVPVAYEELAERRFFPCEGTFDERAVGIHSVRSSRGHPMEIAARQRRRVDRRGDVERQQGDGGGGR
jgi:hypothetical protein